MATSAITLASFPLIGDTPGGGTARLAGQGLVGWLSSAVARERHRRTGGHGSWSSHGWRAEKPMEIDGMIRYATAAAAAEERRVLLALGGLGTSQLVVTDALGTLGVTVEVDDVDIPPIRDSLLSFHFEVTATDPFARATTPVITTITAGSGMIAGAGTFPAELEIVTNATGAVDLTIGGLRLMSTSVPSGTVFTTGPGFTNLPRSVVGPGGEDLFSATLPGCQWPALDVGSNAYMNAGVSVDVTRYPTYA